MRARLVTTLTAAILLTATAAAQAAPAPAAHKPPTSTTCFAGEFAYNAADPGDTCFVGGIFMLSDLGGGHHDLIWGLARSDFHGVRHVVLRADYTIAVNQMEVILIGYVRFRPGGKSWPFRNPVRDKQLCDFHWLGKDHPAFCPPVVNIEHVGGKVDQKVRPCIVDLSITIPDVPAHYGNCSAAGQNGKDKYSSFQVWMPEHRIIGVTATNATPLHAGLLCLTAPVSQSTNAFVHWVPDEQALADLGLQYWYKVPHLHAG